MVDQIDFKINLKTNEGPPIFTERSESFNKKLN